MIFSFHLYLRFHLEPARLAKDQWWVATWGTFDQNGLIIRQIYTLRKNAFRRINLGVQSSGYSGFKFLKCCEIALMMRRTLKLKSLAWKILDEKTQREASVYFQRDYVRRHMRGGLTLNPMISDKVFCVTILHLRKTRSFGIMNFLKAFKQCHTCGYTKVWMIMQRIVFKPRPKQKPALSLPFPSPW